MYKIILPNPCPRSLPHPRYLMDGIVHVLLSRGLVVSQSVSAKHRFKILRKSATMTMADFLGTLKLNSDCVDLP